jgi:hypothetical protein
MIDTLSEVLRSVRLTGGIFLDAHFTAPWCVHPEILAEDCGAFVVNKRYFQEIISQKFGFMSQRNARASVDDAQPAWP